MSFTHADRHFMLCALKLARKGHGHVQPNPMVGCVLVRDDRIIAQGYHQRFGEPHAEVMALHDAQSRSIDPAGAHAYVTLEPCCHFGKTPPCVQALIAAKVGQVTAAMVDPFPAVSGKGLQQLQAAGIPVRVGLCQSQAQWLNAPFIKRIQTGLPWVTLKWAQTLDGKIATRTGQSQWVSSAKARQWVHQQRACVDAILTGIGSVLADDPKLTARGVKLRRVARRVVVDPSLKLPMNCKLVQSLRDDPLAPPLTLAVHEQILGDTASLQTQAKLTQLRQLNVELVTLPPGPTAFADSGKAMLDLQPLLAHLAQKYQATNLWVEGGATLAGALLAQGLADQLCAIIAPKLLGDAQALGAVKGFVVEHMDQARPLALQSVRKLGEDLLLTYSLTELKPMGSHAL